MGARWNRGSIAVATAAVMLACAPSFALGAQGQDRQIAPPATQAAVDRCAVQSAEGAKTADVERVVSGVTVLGGCITDATGISHLFLEWQAEADGARGRVCVDPPIRANVWQCTWDTSRIEPGSYTVTMIAVDAAGNRGSFDQAYRIEAPQSDDAAAPARKPEPQPQPEPEATQPDPSPDPSPDPAPAPAPDPDPLPGGDEFVTPPDAVAPIPLSRVLADRVEECSLLELAPGVRADRALSVAVLECLRPALEVAGATTIELDEIPVPPAVRITFADQPTLDAIDALLPDRVGGVELELVVGSSPPAPEAPAPG